MGAVFFHILEASRPRLWIKNLGLFLPLFISGQIANIQGFSSVCLGVISFCLLSSSNYILNDILDTAKDKKHPLKRHRPLAKQLITTEEAFIAVFILGLSGLLIAYSINNTFFLLASLFVLIHHLSYFFFRRMPVLDVLMIGSGYLIRIMAGESAAGITMSVWLFLFVLSGSLLLAIGKRRNELSIAEEIRKIEKGFKMENFLYSDKMLDSYVAVFSSSTFIAYTYYTFLSAPIFPGLLFRGYTEYLIQILGRKWMMITIPFVLYGIMRYVQLIYNGKRALSKTVTSDIPLIIAVVGWVILLTVVVYGIGG